MIWRELVDATPVVWLAKLGVAEPDVDVARAVLDEDERARADTFVFDADRFRFIRTRCLLKRILAAQLGCEAERVQLNVGQHGRPVLAGSRLSLSFNVAHAGDWAVIGVTPNGNIGVDVELVRPMPELLSIAQSNFTKREFRLVTECNSLSQLELFYWLWTRKEACLKAIGLGIPGGLDRFEVIANDSASADKLPFMSVTARYRSNQQLWVGTFGSSREFCASVAFGGPRASPKIVVLGTSETPDWSSSLHTPWMATR